jgi:hypothetical protein
MADPTYDELRAENAALKARLAVETPIPVLPGGGPSPPHMTRSTDRTAINETPRQTTITHTHVEPTDATFPAAPLAAPFGVGPQRSLVARALQIRARPKTATPEEIIETIKGLKTIIVSGVDSAGYGDKRTEFRSLAELRQILAGLEEELEELQGTGGRIRQIRMTTQWDKGL